jgi:hypothetical protein
MILNFAISLGMPIVMQTCYLDAPDYDQGEQDNKNITVLPDHLFVHTLTTLTTPCDIQSRSQNPKTLGKSA